MISFDEFYKFWSESTKKQILYQYYFDYLELLFYKYLILERSDK